MTKRVRAPSAELPCIFSLPPELLVLVAQRFIHQGTAQDVRTARLVCWHWNALVVRDGDTLVWCPRLWSGRPRDNYRLAWPRDERFPLSLPPGFLDLVLHCKSVDFTWYHLYPLARRVMEENSHSVEEERRLWIEISLRFPETAPLDVVRQLIVYEADKSVSWRGMHTVMHSAPFQRYMGQTMELQWYPERLDAVYMALSMLRDGKW